MLKDVSQQVEKSRITKFAGETIAANKAVIADGNTIYLASSSDVTHMDRVIGISVTSALTGEPVTVQTFGELYEAGWSWDDSKPLWLSIDGELTQTAPVTGFNCVVGSAIDATRIFININDSFELI